MSLLIRETKSLYFVGAKQIFSDRPLCADETLSMNARTPGKIVFFAVERL